MVRIDLVRDKIRRLRQTLAALGACLPADAFSLTGDRDRLDLVSFRVYLAIQEAVDLASHIIADQAWGPAPSLRDHFVILARQGVIDHAAASAMAGGVKVRNLIAHGYAEVDPVKLHAAAAVLPGLTEGFCAAVLGWAEREASTAGKG